MIRTEPGDAGLPETVPARMVNEYVYCPRLFYMEWVEGRFVTSDDVEEGLYVHRVVDEPSVKVPSSDDDLERFAGRTYRSVWLTSTSLGVSAKLDIVEVGPSGEVTPVDYKKGHPDRYGRPWPSDRVQSLLQALLLRESGYQVRRAEVWYAETRRRVEVSVDETSLDEVRTLLAGLWKVAGADRPPLPLATSPKCPRCSLVGLCLPDEINVLRAREQEPRRARAVMAADPDNRPVYVSEQGATVGARRGRLEASLDRETLGSYRLIDVSQLCLFGNVSVTAQAMRELFAREIPVCWFSYGGWFSGLAEGLPAKNVDLRRAQYTTSASVLLDVACRMIEGKIKNCRTLLRRNSRADVSTVLGQLHELSRQAGQVEGYPSLLGVEGTAARLYFSEFVSMLSDDSSVNTATFDAGGRARRPPPDPVNAMLSFLYSILAKDVTVTLRSVGFDPYVGVLHRPRYGRPALALDLAEEFRPLVADSIVLQLVNNGEIRAGHFISRAGACSLTADGRRTVLTAYERRMSHEIRHPVFGYRVNYRRAIDVQARILGAHLSGELSEYTPFTTR